MDIFYLNFKMSLPFSTGRRMKYVSRQYRTFDSFTLVKSKVTLSCPGHFR